MSNATETKSQAYHQLASYLRRNPDAVNHNSHELAERFGLPAELVEDVQIAVRGRYEERAGVQTKPSKLLTPVVHGVYGGAVQPVARGARNVWRFSTESPSWFVGITTVIGILLIYLFSQSTPTDASGGMKLRLDGVSAVVALGVFLLQLCCYYRHGMARHAFYGALINWVIGSCLAIVSVWLYLQSQGKPEQSLLVFAMPIAMLAVASMYAGAGVLFAVLGGFVQVRKAEAQKERLTRQQLLERMFEIEERLRRGPTGEAEFYGLADHPYVQLFRRHPKTSAAVAGLAIGTLYVVLAAWLSALHGNRSESSAFSIAQSATGVVIALAWVLAQAGLAFLARYPLRSLTVATVFAVFSGIPMILPLRGFGFAHLVEVFGALWIPLGILTIVVTIVACLGAMVEERAERERRMRHNDPATLLAEMLDIQYTLTPTTTFVCVMVVDAARSADMKAAADPLLVEYSFREYQRLIGDVSERFGGSVHSTAGDGAVVSFPSCPEAFAAAKRIQTDIEDFNRETNRLKSPFRLRIGLHVGKVAGELEQVQFAEVIDIAAHVQAIAPVGGIAMTQLVAEQLEGEPTVQLKEPVDGHTVMLVLNPTVDH